MELKHSTPRGGQAFVICVASDTFLEHVAFTPAANEVLEHLYGNWKLAP